MANNMVLHTCSICGRKVRVLGPVCAAACRHTIQGKDTMKDMKPTLTADQELRRKKGRF